MWILIFMFLNILPTSTVEIVDVWKFPYTFRTEDACLQQKIYSDNGNNGNKYLFKSICIEINK